MFGPRGYRFITALPSNSGGRHGYDVVGLVAQQVLSSLAGVLLTSFHPAKAGTTAHRGDPGRCWRTGTCRPESATSTHQIAHGEDAVISCSVWSAAHACRSRRTPKTLSMRRCNRSSPHRARSGCRNTINPDHVAGGGRQAKTAPVPRIALRGGASGRPNPPVRQDG